MTPRLTTRASRSRSPRESPVRSSSGFFSATGENTTVEPDTAGAGPAASWSSSRLSIAQELRPTGPVGPSLLRPNDVAKWLAVSRAWVYEAARTGRIPAVRIGGPGGPLRFVPEEIDRWLTETRAGWLPGHNVTAMIAGEPTRSVARTAARRVAGRRSRTGDQQSLL